ncbi:MAG: hypothetical protein K9M57_07100 [Phycisphaerae bacterium]|nr:hypothetical protein [Phycisphaerae bacterium]
MAPLLSQGGVRAYSGTEGIGEEKGRKIKLMKEREEDFLEKIIHIY